MGKIAFIDDMPEADEAFVRAHREELLALAADMGITDVKVASTGRLVGTVTANTVPLGVYAFSADASSMLERIIRMHASRVVTPESASVDLKEATPL